MFLSSTGIRAVYENILYNLDGQTDARLTTNPPKHLIQT